MKLNKFKSVEECLKEFVDSIFFLTLPPYKHIIRRVKYVFGLSSFSEF